MPNLYILDGHETVPVSELLTWAEWFETANRSVARNDDGRGVVVSTVFLGIDHIFGDDPPILFETLVFGGTHDGEIVRCETWEQAEAQHLRMVNLVFAP